LETLTKLPPCVLSRKAGCSRQVVVDLLLFLDGRRVLFDPMTLEEPTHVQDSVLQIRSRLDDDLPRLGDLSDGTPILRTMRRACLQYLTRVPNAAAARENWPAAINELRAGMRDAIEAIERAYDVSMPGGTGRPIRTIYIPGP